MTKQEYLNLLNQTSKNGGFPAVANGICQYKTETGKKCAVGILFPDDITIKHSVYAEALFRDQPELEAYIPEEITPQELEVIQRTHDRQYESRLYNLYGTWDHEKFIQDLLKLDMKPNE